VSSRHQNLNAKIARVKLSGSPSAEQIKSVPDLSVVKICIGATAQLDAKKPINPTSVVENAAGAVL